MDSGPAIAIDLAKEDDIPAILAIANWAASATAANFATEAETLTDWRESWRKTAVSYPWLVARSRGEVVGFAKGSPHRSRGAYRWTAEVSVYVDPKRHGEAIGTRLYRYLIPILRAQGYVTLLAGITPPNPPSEHLHAGFGFVRCGTYHRAGWKFEKWHDVGYWELHLVPMHLGPKEIRTVSVIWPIVRDLRAGARPAILRADLTSSEARSLIGDLNAELSATYPEPGATHFRLDAAEVAEHHGGFFIVDLGREMLGCGAVRAIGSETVELKRMFVVPAWRGLGVSKTLLAALEEESSRIGAIRVRLETGERQEAAIALYERSGYRRIPPFGEYVDSPLSVCMEKTLDRPPASLVCGAPVHDRKDNIAIAWRIRPATATDYEAFVRFFPELAVDDPILEERRFIAELVPTTVVAEDQSGTVVGYAYFQIMGDVAYVRHIVTAPETRRRGVGRGLMEVIADRARSEHCTTWCLNVKPQNTAAVALYERMGMDRAFESRALKIAWSKVENQGTRPDALIATRIIAPEDDRRVELAMQLVVGQLATARATGDRVLLMLEEANEVVGAAIFHPHFPGAYPFRVARPELAVPLLLAIRPHARNTDTLVNLMVEGQPNVAETLVAAGAIVHLEVVHMKGSLPMTA